jgi:hypothetical protein
VAFCPMNIGVVSWFVEFIWVAWEELKMSDKNGDTCRLWKVRLICS